MPKSGTICGSRTRHPRQSHEPYRASFVTGACHKDSGRGPTDLIVCDVDLFDHFDTHRRPHLSSRKGREGERIQMKVTSSDRAGKKYFAGQRPKKGLSMAPQMRNLGRPSIHRLTPVSQNRVSQDHLWCSVNRSPHQTADSNCEWMDSRPIARIFRRHNLCMLKC